LGYDQLVVGATRQHPPLATGSIYNAPSNGNDAAAPGWRLSDLDWRRNRDRNIKDVG